MPKRTTEPTTRQGLAARLDDILTQLGAPLAKLQADAAEARRGLDEATTADGLVAAHARFRAASAAVLSAEATHRRLARELSRELLETAPVELLDDALERVELRRRFATENARAIGRQDRELEIDKSAAVAREAIGDLAYSAIDEDAMRRRIDQILEQMDVLPGPAMRLEAA